MDIFAPYWSRKDKIMNSDGTFIELEHLLQEESESINVIDSLCFYKEEVTEFLFICAQHFFG